MDPGLVIALGEGAQELEPAMSKAADELDALDLAFVPGIVGDPIHEVRTLMRESLPYVAEAGAFAKVAPSLLGLEKPQRWIVLFGNTAEARPSGGFPGGWGVIVADKGQLRLETVESNDRLDDFEVRDWEQIAGFDAASLYSSDMARVLDMGLSPDFEIAGRMFYALYTQNTDGPEPVGILSMDEKALAALMTLTGPVQVDGKPMTADKVADYVTKDVYRVHKDVLKKDAALLGLARDIFAKLQSGETGMLRLIQALLPPMHDGHIRAWHRNPAVQKWIRQTALSGGVQDLKKYSHLVAVANGGGNKLEAYVQVDVQYWGGQCNVRLPFRDSTLRVELNNSAPKSGLPDYVTPRIDKKIFRPKPQGGTREIVFVHVPAGSEFLRARIGDAEVEPLAMGDENGRWVWRFDVELPAQSQRVLLVEFSEPALEEKPFANLWVQPMTLPMTTIERVGPRCLV
jgi:hypothetical protein